jgi:hypothetical protein
MIDFIIPSIGRETILRSCESIIKQTDDHWNAYVGFDGLSDEDVNNDLLVNDSRIQYLYFKEKLGVSGFHGNAGRVRNKIIETIDNPSEWIGFLDDDDSLSQYYVEILRNEISKEDHDCFVFRMNDNGNIIPSFDTTELIQNQVGISFCVKREFIMKYNIRFENSNCEDFLFLQKLMEHSAKIKILPFVGYFVRL